jgi:hypothetical protein
MNVGHNITAKGSHVLMVCVDGSKQSEEAFEAALNLRRKFDHISVFHAYKGSFVGFKYLLLLRD